MNNQEQANNINDLNDPTVANDPQTQVDDLPMSGELEERVKGGSMRIVAGADTKPQSIVVGAAQQVSVGAVMINNA